MQHTVLLVDDEPNVLTGLRRALRKEPYELLSTSSVDEAFTLLRARTVDVVVSDYDMPDMTGIAFLAKVREDFPDTVCFLLTGKATLNIDTQAVHAGTISRLFTKPCSRVELTNAISQVLQQKDALMEDKRLPREVPRDKDGARISILDDICIQECLRQFHGAAAQTERASPEIMQVRRDKDGVSISIPEDISFEECLRQFHGAAAKEVFLVSSHKERITQATLDSIHDTYLIADTQNTTAFHKKGEKLLVVLSVHPQEYYVFLTWIDEVYVGRLKLRYQVSNPRDGTTGRRGEPQVFRSLGR